MTIDFPDGMDAESFDFEQLINEMLLSPSGDWVADGFNLTAERAHDMVSSEALKPENVDLITDLFILGVSFIAMAVWMLIPDKLDDEDGDSAPRMGVFLTTVVAFFLAEMGDKTQIATVALAAKYSNPLLVVIGTTLGMLIADVPAVFVGDKLANKIPMKLVHSIAAGVFAILGVATLLGAGARFGI